MAFTDICDRFPGHNEESFNSKCPAASSSGFNYQLPEAVCHAAIHGIGILDKYYSRTDDLDMYWTAMGIFFSL